MVFHMDAPFTSDLPQSVLVSSQFVNIINYNYNILFHFFPNLFNTSNCLTPCTPAPSEIFSNVSLTLAIFNQVTWPSLSLPAISQENKHDSCGEHSGQGWVFPSESTQYQSSMVFKGGLPLQRANVELFDWQRSSLTLGTSPIALTTIINN